MRKILLIFLLVTIIAPVFAEVFFVPEWSEFCPKKYANVSTDRWHYTSSGRYWSDRRKVFEQRLDMCNKRSESSREACYNSLRDIETKATQMYNSGKTSSALKYLMFNSAF